MSISGSCPCVSNKSDQSGTFETLFERRSEVWTCGSSDLATASIFGSQTERWERRQGKAKARPSCKSFSQLLPAYHSSQRPDTDGSVTPRTSSPLQSTLQGRWGRVMRRSTSARRAWRRGAARGGMKREKGREEPRRDATRKEEKRRCEKRRGYAERN